MTSSELTYDFLVECSNARLREIVWNLKNKLRSLETEHSIEDLIDRVRKYTWHGSGELEITSRLYDEDDGRGPRLIYEVRYHGPQWKNNAYGSGPTLRAALIECLTREQARKAGKCPDCNHRWVKHTWGTYCGCALPNNELCKCEKKFQPVL